MDVQYLVDACQSLLKTQNDFWLLAAITDRSYEEGTRNRGFRESVDSFQAVGVSAMLVQQLKKGINGCLADMIQFSPEILGQVTQNKSRVPDLMFRTKSAEVYVEIKLVYDCTFLKYYPSVAEDALKLKMCAVPNRELIQIVFFTELPNYYYPSGTWYGKKWAKDRRGWLVKRGIDDQFATLQRHLTSSPTWPAAAPYRQELQFPCEAIDEARLGRWFQSVFQPDNRWEFRAPEQLHGAAVGVAIWDWTRNGTIA